MKPKPECTIETLGQALNCLNNALAYITRGPSVVGHKDARKILIKAYLEVLEEYRNGQKQSVGGGETAA